jgi:ATP-dependent RNA helicase DDX27
VTSQLEKTENLIIHQDEIKSRPARTWHQTETQKNEIKLASRDLIKSEENKKRKSEGEINPVHDYKDEFQVDEKDRTHRLSRKKRRKLEALKDTKESNTGDAVPNKSTFHKEKQLPVQKYEEGLISTIGLHHNKKVSRPKFAVGGIDQDLLFEPSKDKVSKRVSKQLAKEKDFSEFDPNKRLKKGGKLGNKSFKSKSKFKRRK